MLPSYHLTNAQSTLAEETVLGPRARGGSAETMDASVSDYPSPPVGTMNLLRLF